MKLVRNNGQVVAVSMRPNSGMKKKRKLRFLGNRNELGEVWEVAVAVSVLAVVENARRLEE